MTVDKSTPFSCRKIGGVDHPIGSLLERRQQMSLADDTVHDRPVHALGMIAPSLGKTPGQNLVIAIEEHGGHFDIVSVSYGCGGVVKHLGAKTLLPKIHCDGDGMVTLAGPD